MQQSRPNQEEQADHAEDNPALSKVIERNIRTIISLRRKAASERSVQDRIADAITAFSGHMVFVYVHIVWFGVWILLNTGWFGMPPFDPFPYGLLTMVVSLEAIFLATFVLISQNRLSAEAEYRADLDLHIGLLTEHERQFRSHTNHLSAFISVHQRRIYSRSEQACSKPRLTPPHHDATMRPVWRNSC